MKDRILQTLNALRDYAISKGLEAAFLYHEEDSYLMRFANSAISLNTNEHLIRLEITAYDGTKRASYDLITDLGKLDEMKQGIDIASEMVKHAQPLTYQPTIPVYTETFVDENGYDAALAMITNQKRLEFFNAAVAGIETDEIRLSGIFSNGTNIVAMINTRSEHSQFFKTSDAQISIVLSHTALKWEVTVEQSAQKASELDPSALRRDLAFLVAQYQQNAQQQIPVGRYDIVFGATAIADLISVMNWIGFNGGLMKRGFSFTTEAQLGTKIFSEKFTLTDDPTRLETYPFQRDAMGMPRHPFPLLENGVFKAYAWQQDDADEFNAQPTGHTVPHKSLVMKGGDMKVTSLEELVNLPRDNDILYIPFLHYMNLVNPSKGLVTASSRFGALLLKKDGSLVVPYNVRVTQSLLDIFGDKVAWLSNTQVINNTSQSYGARNPTAIITPAFIRVNDLEVSHSNAG